jgi:thiol-disulfide isomerase/thioredoxin
MAPIVHGLETEYFGEINFVYLDIDDPENAKFLDQLGFRYQPHFFLIDGEGKILQQWLGPVTGEDFRMAFEGQLQ